MPIQYKTLRLRISTWLALKERLEETKHGTTMSSLIWDLLHQEEKPRPTSKGTDPHPDTEEPVPSENP